MELVKLGKKGQVTIPRSIPKAIGISDEAQLLVEAASDGTILLRQAGMYPVEIYTDVRIREFEQRNTIPSALEAKAVAFHKKKRKNRCAGY